MSARIIIVMGVSGVGKTSIAQGLADHLGGQYVEADDYHPPENVEAMRNGIPLNDDMRRPWLLKLGQAMAEMGAAQPDQPLIATCSALKAAYRDILRTHLPEAVFVYLHGERDLIATRMAARENHYMPLSLLDSQLDTLEVPQAPENFVKVDVTGTIEEIIQDALKALA